MTAKNENAPHERGVFLNSHLLLADLIFAAPSRLCAAATLVINNSVSVDVIDLN
jgi:hypothetical protein